MSHLQGIRHKLTTSTAVLATAVLLVGGGVAVAQNAASTAADDAELAVDDIEDADDLEEVEDPVDDEAEDGDDPDDPDSDPSEGGDGDEGANGDDDASDPDVDADADAEADPDADLDGDPVEELEEVEELAPGGSACAAGPGEPSAADAEREDRRSDTAKRVHHALTGTPDLRPGDPNFGRCVSERARQGKLGPLVSRAARGDDGWDDDLTPLPKGKPGGDGEVDAATEGAPSADEAKRGRPDHAGPPAHAGPKDGASQQRGRPDHAGPPAHAGPKSGAGDSSRPGGGPKPDRGGGRG